MRFWAMVIVILVQQVTVRVTFYYPELGGINCGYFVDGECRSRTASGERWQDWLDRGLACPKEFPLWSTWIINGKKWTCIDRGGWVYIKNGVVRVDLLTRHSPLSGHILEATVIYSKKPKSETTWINRKVLDIP